ncbi:MAG TPA: amino acid adenylation domain-containing protein, partial [Herpetosiphonaceae bacterium]
DLEGHGREDLFDEVDLSRTVGWFTSIFPVRLDLGTAQQPGAALTTIKEQLRQIPQHGIGYGLLRYLGPPEMQAALAGMPPAEVSFNYLGQIDQAIAKDSLFAPARESPGPVQSARNGRTYLLEVTGFVLDGCFHLNWDYSAAIHHRATIASLVDAYRAAIQRVIAHSSAPDAHGYTPADFPLARLDQALLDRIVAHERQIEDIYPLSPMQQGMLFHTLYESETGLYVEQLACRLEGPIAIDAFQRAWAMVIERHPILRTGFVWEDIDTPLQVVRQQVTLPWQIEDWRDLSRDDQAAHLATCLAQDRRRGFALGAAPLVRLALFQVGTERYDFVWSYHHLLLDGWSVPLVLREVFAAYAALRHGQRLELARPWPYRDYIAWLHRQDLARAETFWRHLLRGFCVPTPLGVERRSSGDASAASQMTGEMTLSRATTAALERLARQHGLTMSTLVQGAWALLLSRYSGEQDIVYGATVSGRPPELEGVEEMVGLFINTLPVRVQVGANDTVHRYLAQVQAVLLELRQYEYSPLAQVQRWSDVPQGQPLFESIVVFENYPIASLTAARRADIGLAISDVRTIEQSNYALTLAAVPGQELTLRLNYDSQRFDRERIDRLLGHLETLLAGFAADPDQPLGAVPLLTEAEQRLLMSWNATTTAFPTDTAIHHLFAAQAARTPDAVALVCGAETLTYRALDQRANQLAHHLRRLGVGGCPQGEVGVGLYLDRSLDLVVGLLGILKAGGAYVPLDPAYPAERLQFMLADAQVPVLLSQQTLAPGLPQHQARLVCLDADWPSIAPLPSTAPATDHQANDLAYLIYTSGTTGRPKAVQVEHGSLSNTLLASQERFRFQADDIMPWIASVAFDIALFELFSPLLVGGTARILTQAEVLDLPQFVETLRACTRLHTVPSLMRQIVRAIHDRQLPPAAFAAMRQVFVGGEAVPPDLLPAMQAIFPQAAITVLYGPTEATIICTSYAVPRDEAVSGHPIGRPLPNSQLRLYDPHQRLVPIGVIGEIYLGGGGVTRGYRHQLELTAEKYVVVDGQRWYRTGDLARYRADGTVEFLGRRDAQVKLRGFRIELSEIEGVLRQQPAVQDAAVIVHDDSSGDARLVAYVVPEVEAALTLEDLQQALQRALPAYMVPAAFVVLPALPLNAHGKVDRAALPDPNASRLTIETDYVAPRSPTEAVLATIWADVLRLDRVGIHDHFFALGGDSILTIQIIARAHQAGVHLTPRQIFQHPTIAQLAAVAGTPLLTVAEQGIVTGPVPLTPIQHHFFALDLMEPNHFNQAVLLQVQQPLDPALLEQAVRHLVAHHDALRLRITPAPTGWQQQIVALYRALRDGPLTRVIDLSAIPATEQPGAITVAATEIQTSLNLSSGPLIRVAYLHLGAQRPGRLLVVIHHLAVDAVSWPILLEDFQSAYTQLRQQAAVTLPPKTTSFKAWAERLVSYAQSAALHDELAYWLRVAGHPVPSMPVDRRDRPSIPATTEHLELVLSAADTHALLHEVPRAYRTRINDVLLTALALAWAQWAQSPVLRLDLEGHGREDLFDEVDLSRTVGWFTSIFPVR